MTCEMQDPAIKRLLDWVARPYWAPPHLRRGILALIEANFSLADPVAKVGYANLLLLLSRERDVKILAPFQKRELAAMVNAWASWQISGLFLWEWAAGATKEQFINGLLRHFANQPQVRSQLPAPMFEHFNL